MPSLVYALLSMTVLHTTAATSNPSTPFTQGEYQKGSKLPITRVQNDQLRFRRSQSSMMLSNQNKFSYLVPIRIGGQSFPLILDTGSSDLWVVSDKCSSKDCSSVSRYSQPSSKDLETLGTPFDLSYLKGSVSGVVALDVVSLGSFEIRPQVFGLADDIKDMNLAGNGHSGILGLSFPSEASISPNVAPTVLENIFKYLDEPYFAIKLGTSPGPNDPTSSLTFGQLDEKYASHLSEFFFTPVSTAGASGYTYWKVSIQTFIVDGQPVQLSPSTVRGVRDTQIAVVDTGTTLIVGPTSDVDAIWGATGSAARYNTNEKIWEVRCNKAVDIRLVLGNRDRHVELPIDYEDVNWDEGEHESGWCIGGIQANDDVSSGDWLLGDAFLRSVYTVHFIGNTTHPPSMGFLGTVDRNVTYEQFRAKRGPDLDQSSPPPANIQGVLRTPARPAAPMVYSLGSAGGFIGGAAAMTAFRMRRRFLAGGL